MATTCTHCACTSTAAPQAHAVLALLDIDDLDAALAGDLLDGLACPACDPQCNALLAAARDARLAALAARHRHLARVARLRRRKEEREAARVPKGSTARPTPALPTAAADVLMRALAKALKPK